MNVVINTCKEILIGRGYRVETETETHIIGIPDENSNISAEYHKPSEKICIFLDNTNNDFNVSKTTEYITRLSNIKINHCIIIYKDKITAVAKKISESINDYKIELFPMCDLMYNITKHELVSVHKKLSSEEAKKFKLKYGENIPYLLTQDPVSRFYGYNKKDIIEIIRPNGFVTYRIVK